MDVLRKEQVRSREYADLLANTSGINDPFEISLDHIFRVEGSKFTNHPQDRGGPTKYGITQSNLAEYRGRKVTAQDVEFLTQEEAKQIYKSRYWLPMNLGFLSQEDFRVPLALFDQGVNRGPKTAIMMAQMILNTQFRMPETISVDGILGPITRSKIERIDPGYFVLEYIQLAQHSYLDIVLRRPDQMVFLKGWLNRTHILQDMVTIGRPNGQVSSDPVPKPAEPQPVPSKNALAPYNWMKKELGISEYSGSKNNERIVFYHSFTSLKATDDETPWCSSIMCAAHAMTGFPHTGSAAAKSWLNYGKQGDGSEGDIVVFKRIGGNHVGFVAKKYRQGDSSIYVLGGNQGNAVSYKYYPMSDFLDFRRA